MTHNRFSSFHCVYIIIQVVHTEFIKVVVKVFSLQEFKQNDSRTSHSSNSYRSNFWEKQVKEKEKVREESVWNLGLKEEKLRILWNSACRMQLEDKYSYNILLWMTSENSEEIFQLIKDNVTKENTEMRELILPRL